MPSIFVRKRQGDLSAGASIFLASAIGPNEFRMQGDLYKSKESCSTGPGQLLLQRQLVIPQRSVGHRACRSSPAPRRSSQSVEGAGWVRPAGLLCRALQPCAGTLPRVLCGSLQRWPA